MVIPVSGYGTLHPRVCRAASWLEQRTTSKSVAGSVSYCRMHAEPGRLWQQPNRVFSMGMGSSASHTNLRVKASARYLLRQCLIPGPSRLTVVKKSGFARAFAFAL